MIVIYWFININILNSSPTQGRVEGWDAMKPLKNFLPTDLKRILVQTLVMPHFDYCDVLLTDLSTNIQKNCNAFIICGSDTSSTSGDMIMSLHISTSCPGSNSITVEKLQCLVLLFIIFHTSTPSYLVSRFHLLSSNHNLNTRSYHNSFLNIPHHRTSL